MNKYEIAKNDLASRGVGSMRCFGDSMHPIIESGSKISFRKQTDYKVGDIVFCNVEQYWIDAHIVTKKEDKRGYFICGNDGSENGWTKSIYGRAVLTEHRGKVKNL